MMSFLIENNFFSFRKRRKFVIGVGRVSGFNNLEGVF